MERIVLKGMTWDHRRAVDPLTGTAAPFLRLRPDVTIAWDSRPLSGFEFTSVDRLAQDYDFIVLDHPFSGAVAASGSLLPVDEVVAGLADRFVGPSLASYTLAGHVWALPIDAATQVQAVRPDLLDRLDAEVPRDWRALMALGEKARRNGLRLAMALAGVHSLMTFYTLCANLGTPCATDPQADFCDRPTAREALGLMRDLLALCPAETLDWNSIRLHDEMVARDDLVACPAVYCYATYAERDQRRPLRFHDFPGPDGPRGTTIGGTGLGISARCRHRDAALDYARFVAEAGTQIAFAHHHGQPARVEAWEDDAVNDAFGGCYRDTRTTQDSAWIRPRYNGYLTFQERAGPLIEAHLREGGGAETLIDRLAALHHEGGRGQRA